MALTMKAVRAAEMLKKNPRYRNIDPRFYAGAKAPPGAASVFSRRKP